MTHTTEIRHFHLFCGLGGGAAGFNAGQARVGNLSARFRCLGGIDCNPVAVKNFNRLAGVEGTVLDLFDRRQYTDFHGAAPPPGWKEAAPADIHRAANNERPHIVFLSAPCKGFSGLLSNKISATRKYQALNRLTLRGIWLMLEAWADDPPEFVLFENVPRIMNRGRDLLDRITEMLRSYGYAVSETTHDCGKLGGLAQSRKRFLLVARHQDKTPCALYEPLKKPLLPVGDLLGRMPLPGDDRAGPMHRIPRLQWKTWVRLAFVEAGKDWRSLDRLRIKDGYLQDYLIIPEPYRNNYLGVCSWGKPAGTVTTEALPTNGKYSVSDPRFPGNYKYRQYGVIRWDQAAPTIINVKSPGQGAYAVQDPRLEAARFSNQYRIVRFEEVSRTITSDDGAGICVSDPRVGLNHKQPKDFVGNGRYGVLPWDNHSSTISAAGKYDNGPWSVADPRLPQLDEKTVAVIRALDGTWHRPFTTLELAVLQGLVEPEEFLRLEGRSDREWREQIGNAVPPGAAEAIAGVMGEALLLAWSGETFVLNAAPQWCKNIAIALSVDDPQRLTL